MGGDGTFKIGDCLVEQGRDRISRGFVAVTVRPQVMDVLVYLASQGGKIVHADDLLDHLWPGKVVTSASIYNCISELRSALLTCDETQPYIETVPRRGYRLVAPVTILEASPENAPDSRESLTRAVKHKLVVVTIALLSLGMLAAVIVKQFVPTDDPRLGPRSVLILPFSNDQEEQADIYADGLLGEILTQLHKIETVTTVGRATAMYYRESDKSIEMIAEELGVATVMSGNLIEAAGHLRFDLELLEARTGKTLWMESYELPHAIDELFRVQSDIAVQVANALEAELSPAELRQINDRRLASQLAYDHYLRGEVYRQRTRLQEAIVEYEQATEEDPGFAAAWAELAVSRAWASYTGLAQATMEQARFSLEHARQLAPEAFDTQKAEAIILGLTTSPGKAIQILQKLLESRPGSVELLVELSGNNMALLRVDQAKEFAERAVMLDPMSVEATWQLAFAHAWSWEFEDAGAYYDRALALETESPHRWRFWQRFQIFLWGQGDTTAARRMLDSAPATISTLLLEIQLAYVNRDLQTMQDLFGSAEGGGLDKHAMEARLYWLKGDVDRQIASAESMRLAAEATLEALLSRGAPRTDVEAARSEIAVAMALAGNEAEAIRTIELALAKVASDPDRLNAVPVYQNEVLIHVLLGQNRTATQRLRYLLSWAKSPALTPNRLRLDPDFDALRDDPDFAALIEELTNDVI